MLGIVCLILWNKQLKDNTEEKVQKMELNNNSITRTGLEILLFLALLHYLTGLLLYFSEMITHHLLPVKAGLQFVERKMRSPDFQRHLLNDGLNVIKVYHVNSLFCISCELDFQIIIIRIGFWEFNVRFMLGYFGVGSHIIKPYMLTTKNSNYVS